MQVMTITDEELNVWLTSSMVATAKAFKEEGLIDETAMDAFISTHACSIGSNEGWLSRVVKKIYPDLKDDKAVVVVLKVGK